ncbi:MAG: NAD(P)-dependent oxidoreductase [Bacteroidales bacterium]|nr:NAD(P)-dependent oxidoreductase [Bacteroidales bacterium]
MKIAVLEPLGVSTDFLKEKIVAKIGTQHDLIFYPDRKEDAATLVERSQGADIVVLSNIPYRKDVIEKCPALKKICVAFTGVDHIDLAYCAERGIEVKNCAGYSTVAVADLTFGLVLSLARNIPACDRACRDGKTKDGLVGFELAGKKFGIVGLGAIGSRVADIAHAFGCEVFAYTRTPKNHPNVTLVDKETLFRTCDIVSLHTPLNDSTRGLVGEKELSWMKPTAYLINTARGGVVDTHALVDALRNHRIAGAGIDVFDMEPPIPSDYQLNKLPNVVVTPHVAFATKQAFEKRALIIADNLAGWTR